MNLPVKKTKAFTLIELLVVITIIAILVALLIPAISTVKNQANKTKARNALQNIIVAIKAYDTDYGKYPIDETGGSPAADITYGDMNKGYGASKDNAELIDVLRYNISGSHQNIVQSLNPRGTPYLEAPLSKVSPAKSEIDPKTGGYYDPWSAEYYIMIDGNYDHQLTPPSGLPGLSTDANSTKPLSSSVIGWSLGRKQQDTITTW